MSQNTNRRKFLKVFGLTTGVTLSGTGVLAAFIDQNEIRQLNPEQQKLMHHYGEWMDRYITSIRDQKAEPENMQFKKDMITLIDEGEKFQPEIMQFMKDPTFAFIFKNAVQRVTKEIPS